MPSHFDLPGVELRRSCERKSTPKSSPLKPWPSSWTCSATFNERRKGSAHRSSGAAEADSTPGRSPHFSRMKRRDIRESAWTVAPLPADILDRRVEITGPVDRKMIINALNSGAKVFMADFEDSSTPTWNNLLDGQINLRDAIRRTITYRRPGNGKAIQAQ